MKSQPWCQISCHLFQEKYPIIRGFPGGSVVKNPLASAGDAGVVVLIPESKRCPGGGITTHSSILAWEIPWAEESGGLQSMKSRKSGTRLNDWAHTHTSCAQHNVIYYNEH